MSEDLTQIDHWIRQGELKRAQIAILNIEPKDAPRSHVLTLAQLSWRAGVPMWGVQALYPFVSPDAKPLERASDEERVEYALCLSKIGASSDSLMLLDGVKEKNSRWAFAMAAAHVNRWNYAESIQYLKAYVLEPNLNLYERLIGQVNVLAALVYERQHAQVDELMGAIEEPLQMPDHQFLWAKTQMLMVQDLIVQRDLDKAKRILSQADQSLKNASAMDRLFVDKWRLVIQLIEKRDLLRVIDDLNSIKQQSRKLQDWETPRQIDRWIGEVMGEPALLCRTYFGTPFASFRNWLRRDLEGIWSPPEEYVWAGGEGATEILDLSSGMIGKANIKVGSLPYKMLVGLCSDFYRPLWMASFHRILYKDRHFNPNSSPDRIHQVKRQLRKWFEKAMPSTTIEEYEGQYQLSLGNRFGVLTRGARSPDMLTHQINRLRQGLGSKAFNIKEAMAELQMSRTSLSRVLAEAADRKQLVREGTGRSTRYRFVA